MSKFRFSLAPLLFLAITLVLCSPERSLGFVTPSNQLVSQKILGETSHSNCRANSNTSLHAKTNRRNFLEQSIFVATASLPIYIPLSANAKEKEPITAQSVKDAFDAIRYELNSNSGVVATLEQLIEKQNYEEIMQFTKESDAYFRKAKIGKARKMLTDKSVKDDALQLSNAVTFDLIGINRASRPGKENKEEAMRYLVELKNDIQKILALEDTIVLTED